MEQFVGWKAIMEIWSRMSKNYYDILEVTKEANQEEIKKAYRKLAMQYHPDRNIGDSEAEVKFKEVQEAYDILSDPQKKAMIDNPGMGGFGHSFFSDFFDNIFRAQQTHSPIQLNIQTELVITFWEAVKGCQKTVTVNRAKMCNTCQGSGAAERETCSYCQGTGKHIQRAGNMTVQTTCPTCGGAGQTKKKDCQPCNGQGIISESVNVQFNIPAGVSDNTGLRLEKQGNHFNGRIGDIIAHVRVQQHEIFERIGNNLVYVYPITYSQAVLGAEITVPTLNDDVVITIPKVTKTGTQFRVKDKGFTDLYGKTGDLVVQVVIETIDYRDELGYKHLVEELNKWERANPSTNLKRFLEKTKHVT